VRKDKFEKPGKRRGFGGEADIMAQWTEETWQDIDDADMSRSIAICPLAAVEQHGPHLPLGTDCMIMEGYLALAAGSGCQISPGADDRDIQ
jgi:hypothetical protein